MRYYIIGLPLYDTSKFIKVLNETFTIDEARKRIRGIVGYAQLQAHPEAMIGNIERMGQVTTELTVEAVERTIRNLLLKLYKDKCQHVEIFVGHEGCEVEIHTKEKRQ